MDQARPAGLWPRRGACGLLALLLASGCARQVPTTTAAHDGRELAQLRSELADRDRQIEQLHGKLALLEAGQRDAAERLAQASAEGAARCEASFDDVRANEREQVRAEQARTSEARPLLKLHGEGTRLELAPSSEPRASREFTSTWTPPTTQERLLVAPVPALPSIATPRGENASRAAPEDTEARYIQALELVRRRDFAAAVRELDAFLRAHPDDVRVARVLYWRGEVLFAQRDYARALASYEQALAREPQGERAPDLLLRVARCQLSLGDRERARDTLSELRARFPGSAAARVALQLEQEDT
jgi:tol-pal system protein YbgF